MKLEGNEERVFIHNKEIKELNARIAQLQTNKNITRLIDLLDNEDIQMKFEAFLTINEKARYYKKYETI
jgi:hypothetical protein